MKTIQYKREVKLTNKSLSDFQAIVNTKSDGKTEYKNLSYNPYKGEITYTEIKQLNRLY